MAGTMHAPGALRRRVIDSVRSEPSRRKPAAATAARAALSRAALLALPTALAAVALAVILGGGSGHRPVPASHLGSPRATLHVVAGRGELMLADIPESPAGTIYELWERRAGVPRMLPTDALFGVARGGRAAVGVPGALQGLRELLVTLEPVGGSSVPTGSVLLRIEQPGATS